MPVNPCYNEVISMIYRDILFVRSSGVRRSVAVADYVNQIC